MTIRLTANMSSKFQTNMDFGLSKNLDLDMSKEYGVLEKTHKNDRKKNTRRL